MITTDVLETAIQQNSSLHRLYHPFTQLHLNRDFPGITVRHTVSQPNKLLGILMATFCNIVSVTCLHHQRYDFADFYFCLLEVVLSLETRAKLSTLDHTSHQAVLHNLSLTCVSSIIKLGEIIHQAMLYR